MRTILLVDDEVRMLDLIELFLLSLGFKCIKETSGNNAIELVKTYTREELLHSAWEYETEIDIRTIDSHIRNLREKLRNTGFPTDNFLNTVWGIGYKWG